MLERWDVCPWEGGDRKGGLAYRVDSGLPLQTILCLALRSTCLSGEPCLKDCSDDLDCCGEGGAGQHLLLGAR